MEKNIESQTWFLLFGFPWITWQKGQTPLVSPDSSLITLQITYPNKHLCGPWHRKITINITFFFANKATADVSLTPTGSVAVYLRMVWWHHAQILWTCTSSIDAYRYHHRIRRCLVRSFTCPYSWKPNGQWVSQKRELFCPANLSVLAFGVWQIKDQQKHLPR